MAAFWIVACIVVGRGFWHVLDQFQQKNTELQATVERQANNLSGLTSQATALTGEVNHLKEQFKKDLDDSRTEFKAYADSLRAQNQLLEKELNGQVEQADRILQDMNGMQEKLALRIASLNAELNEQKKELASNEKLTSVVLGEVNTMSARLEAVGKKSEETGALVKSQRLSAIGNAKSALRENRPDTAISLLQPLVSGDERSEEMAQIRLLLACACLEAATPEDALKQLEPVFALPGFLDATSPKLQARAHLEKAECLLMLGRLDSAEIELKRIREARETSDEQQTAFAYQLLVALNRGRASDARRELENGHVSTAAASPTLCLAAASVYAANKLAIPPEFLAKWRHDSNATSRIVFQKLLPADVRQQVLTDAVNNNVPAHRAVTT